MVDVSGKPYTPREARAGARLLLEPVVAEQLWQGRLPKGEALAVARIAGIQAAKATASLIPLCHPLALSEVQVEFERADDGVQILCTARTVGPTGVEMEAMTGAAVAALTLYDMVKAVQRGARIAAVELLYKSGGKSGTWQRGGEE